MNHIPRKPLTRCTTSSTHASTKNVPRSQTYHNNICVSTMYQIIYQTINLYHTKHQLCTTTCTTTSASTMQQHMYHVPQTLDKYINTIPSTNPVPYHVSTRYINHHTMYQYYTITCTIQCVNRVPTMHINRVHQPCTNQIPRSPTISSTIYHIKKYLKHVIPNQIPNNE